MGLTGLHVLLQLPAVDEVEFWHDAEKTGWLQSQGEHLKNWRRRYFVLKQGYLFRFAGPDINSGTKPRGVVDLSKVCCPIVYACKVCSSCSLSGWVGGRVM